MPDPRLHRGSDHPVAATDPAARYAELLLTKAPLHTDSARAQQDFAQRTVAQLAAAAVVADDWARSGLMPLCGHGDGPPLRAQHAIPTCARGALDALRQITGVDVLPGVDGATLLSERAAYHGWPRRGQTSVNGHCHLLPSADGWVALNLARDEDIEMLPALFAPVADVREREQLVSGEPAVVRGCVARMHTQDLLQRGRLFGLALGAPPTAAFLHTAGWQQQLCIGAHRPRRADERPKVLDLSALWAGPLCTHLLAAAGAAVCKVESATRPDASQSGLPAFYTLLNAGKSKRVLDFRSADGIKVLREMIAGVDIVIEGARPRALHALGIDAKSCVEQQPGLLWLRITGHGSTDDRADWVAFGDDAAIAGGAAIPAKDGPLFCGDALADPLTGLHAAVAAWHYWQDGHAALIDVSLAGVTGWCVQFARDLPYLDVPASAVCAPKRR